MLSVINVYTNSIDDSGVAVADILTQLKDKKFLKNSVGIISCHSDYVEDGVIGAIKESLPFDVVGCAVFGSAINGHGGVEHLVLTVLTSDDVVFSTVLSDTISKGNVESPIEKIFAEASNSLGGEPNLIFMFGPLIADVIGDQMLAKLDQLGRGVPVFGTLANDTTPGYTKSYVFRNGEYALGKMALLMIRGNINPRFHVTSVSKRSIQHAYSVVTDSDGYLVKAINYLSVLDYFASLGITAEKLVTLSMVPLLVDFGDGTTPIAYSMYNISANGAYCGGVIPKGAKVTFTDINTDSVMATAETTLQTALDDAEKNGANGIIAIPCISRALLMSPNVDAEIAKSLAIVGDKVPFTLIYSGGEICPVYNQQGILINRFHNLTYTLVVF